MVEIDYICPLFNPPGFKKAEGGLYDICTAKQKKGTAFLL